MNLYICLGEGGAMTFNGRRVSRDRRVIEDIIRQTEGRLFIFEYSRELFSDFDRNVSVVDGLDGEGDYFIEQPYLMPPSRLVDTLTVYNWNRRYPADGRFEMYESFSLAHRCELVGYSHERITREIWCGGLDEK